MFFTASTALGSAISPTPISFTTTLTPTSTISTAPTLTPALTTSVLAMNTAYSDALQLANSITPYLYYSDTYNTKTLKKNFYNDLNEDKHVQKTVVKYYYYKIFDKWLYEDLLPLLAYVDVDNNGEIRLIKSLNDYDVKKLGKEPETITQKKIKYMENKIISKDLVKHVLKKICTENNINWYGLKKYNGKIKKILFKYLSNKIKNAIERH